MLNYSRYHRPTDAEKAERAVMADKVMRDLIEALKPRNIVLRFPHPEKGERAVEAAKYGEGLLPNHAWPCRPGSPEDITSIYVCFESDGSDDLHGKPFHMDISRYGFSRRNRNKNKYRFKGNDPLTLTTAMVTAVIEALAQAEAEKAREQDDAKARDSITGVLKSVGIIPPGGNPSPEYKDFDLSVHEGYFTARWSVYPRPLTPHQMACVLTGVATAVRFDAEMLDSFDDHSLTLKVKADQVNTFKAVATLVEGCANDFDKANKAKVEDKA